MEDFNFSGKEIIIDKFGSLSKSGTKVTLQGSYTGSLCKGFFWFELAGYDFLKRGLFEKNELINYLKS